MEQDKETLAGDIRALAGSFPEMEMPARCQDRLDDLFRMQSELNDLAFRTQGLVDRTGSPLTMAHLVESAKSALADGKCSVNSITSEWLQKYTKALGAEVQEIQEALPWKWWSKSGVDIAHIQEEAIDVLHFFLSLALVAGLDSETLMNAYFAKYKVNVIRQINNYVARGDIAA